jgi:hypothetical protein
VRQYRRVSPTGLGRLHDGLFREGDRGLRLDEPGNRLRPIRLARGSLNGLRLGSPHDQANGHEDRPGNAYDEPSHEGDRYHVPIPHSCRNIMTTSDMPNNGVNVM